jgi:hypothetical protein
MLTVGMDASLRLRDRWVETVGTVDDDPETAETLETVTDAAFPGGILPCRCGDGHVYYAVADSPRQWRQLAPLLTSFCGPTVTDFRGRPTALERDDAREAVLLDAGLSSVACLKPSASTERLARRLFARMRQTLARAQIPTRTVPQPTSALLDQFRSALVAPSREDAQDALDRLRSEWRLDALNVSFLEVALRSAFGEWDELRRQPSFLGLCETRRPPAVTLALLETVYRTELSPLEGNGREALIVRFKTSVWPTMGGLFTHLPGNATDTALKAFLVRAAAFPMTPEASARLDSMATTPDLVALRRMLIPDGGAEDSRDGRPSGAPPVNIPPDPPSCLDAAATALLHAVREGSLEACAAARQAIETLSSADRSTLLAQPLKRELWRTLCSFTGDSPAPRGWTDWLSILGDTAFEGAVEVAERAAAEWRVDAHLYDPVHARDLAALLLAVPDGIAQQRLQASLPILVTWLISDPRYPNPLAAPVYGALLTIFALQPGRTELSLATASHVLDAAIACGPAADTYAEILDSVGELAAGANGVRQIDWLLDTIETTIAYPCPAPEARQRLWLRVLDILRRGRRPDRLQLLTARSLATTLGVGTDDPVLELPPSGESEGRESSALARLAGMRLVIYTLTETVGRHAMASLTSVVSRLKVELSTDHVGSARLKSLAEKADLFVIATQSAKHAATEFIQRHRPDGMPILYPRGRGSTSIVSALKGYAERLGTERDAIR